MRLSDGREAICTLALPLPFEVLGALGKVVVDALEQLGYRDVTVTDGSSRVVARPPEPPPG